MLNYTWVANLLKEIDVLATECNVVGISENLALACAALISDTKDKADISPEARDWLDSMVSQLVMEDQNSDQQQVNFS